MSEPAFAQHLFEEVFHDEDVERTDEVEIDHSQFVVVFHDRTREDFAAFDVDGHVGYQVLVVQGDDRFVGRPFGDGHETAAFAVVQGFFQFFPAGPLPGFQPEGPDQQVAQPEEKLQPCRAGRPECRHHLVRGYFSRNLQAAAEAVAVIGVGVADDPRIFRERRFAYFHDCADDVG